MKRAFLFVILMIILIPATILIPARNALAMGPHNVEGSATTDMENWVVPVTGTVTFVAIQTNPVTQTARGVGYLNFPDYRVHVNVRYLSVDTPAHTAWLGVVVTRSSGLSCPPIGTEMVWEVQDNGKGTKDIWSLIYYDSKDALVHPDVFNICLNHCIKGNFIVK
jgi:hypothetical protein